MAAGNRHNPTRTACSNSGFSLMEFMRDFPDGAACPEHLWRSRYAPDGEHAECPKCERERKVSHRWLHGYLNEFVWHRNARCSPTSMFESLLDTATHHERV